jgi:hypothetical protein
MRTLLALVLCMGTAHAQTYNSRTDSIGQTHFDGTDRNGNRYSGIARRDSIGQVHTSIRSGNTRTECLARTDSIGNVHQDCH